MAQVQRSKRVTAGDWRTLESGFNATFSCRFVLPAGAEIKIRYGAGSIFGADSQRQTLDGTHPKTVSVGRASLAYARVQMKVKHDIDVTYLYIPDGSGPAGVPGHF